MSSETRRERARAVQHERAGFVTQVAGGVLDGLVIIAIYFGILVAIGFVKFLFVSHSFTLPRPGAIVNGDAIWVIGVVLLTSAWSGTGRAPGMAVIGLRIVTTRGERLSTARALVRAILVMTTLGIGLVVVLFSKRNKSLYDMICGTAAIYDWRPRLSESRQDR